MGRTGVHRNSEKYWRRLHLSLYERSKSTLAASMFHAISQPSYTIPTINLLIKQGSHSHALTNDF